MVSLDMAYRSFQEGLAGSTPRIVKKFIGGLASEQTCLTSAAVFCTSSRAPKSVVDFTDFDESDTESEGNIARFEEAA